MNEVSHNLLDDVAEILISEERIRERTREIAQEIIKDYEEIGDLLLICVLKGAFMFLADLSRELERPHSLDFMGVSSYGAGTVSSGAVRIVMDLKEDIAGRHVLIVEDIIDSGHTLEYLLRTLHARSPASIRICSLLSKPSRREVDVPFDYIGFEIPDEFVVGYGLDFGEIYRNLPFIAILKPDIFADII
jgi:hypoxanthine phosphoribosyltransferase